MARWRNWSGKLETKVTNMHFVRSEEDAAALAALVDQQDGKLRVAGAGHSHAQLIGHSTALTSNPTPITLADLSGLCGVVSVNQSAKTAWIWAGTPIYTLGRSLGDVGLALHNQGDIDRQTLAGAVATGTHGTGTTLSNLSSAVLGARIALPNGNLVETHAGSDPELWQAAKLSLGALGIVTQLQMQLRDAYRLVENSWQSPFHEFVDALPEQVHQHRHLECFWYPQTDEVQAKTLDETDEPAQYPVAAEGSRCAWSYDVLPNYRPHPHTEMEYSVPADRGPDCFRAIRKLLQTEFPDVQWPVEYRTLAADDVWLSTAFERPTVTISVHQAVTEDEQPYYQACEAIFREFDGRPHWGKVNYLKRDTFAQAYKRLPDWLAVQKRVDPKGTCLNTYLEGLFGASL